MYELHLKHGIKGIEWERNMWFSLIQQLIRMDPAYYMMYVFFRPDHAYRLISYSYYAKNTFSGEATRFSHININIRDYVDTGRGGNVYQGSVSLTDEDSKSCAEILAGMQKPGNMADWYGVFKSRESEREGCSVGDGLCVAVAGRWHRLPPQDGVARDQSKYTVRVPWQRGQHGHVPALYDL